MKGEEREDSESVRHPLRRLAFYLTHVLSHGTSMGTNDVFYHNIPSTTRETGSSGLWNDPFLNKRVYGPYLDIRVSLCSIFQQLLQRG